MLVALGRRLTTMSIPPFMPDAGANRMGDGGVGVEAAGGRPAVALFGEQGDATDSGGHGEFGEGIDADTGLLIGGDAAAVGFFDFGVQFEGIEIGIFSARIMPEKALSPTLKGLRFK